MIRLLIHWSGNIWRFKAKTFGLSPTNKFENFTYRLKLIYVGKDNHKRAKYFKYNKKLWFILKPEYKTYNDN